MKSLYNLSLFTQNLYLKGPPHLSRSGPYPHCQLIHEPRILPLFRNLPAPLPTAFPGICSFLPELNRLTKEEIFRSWAGDGGNCCPHISWVTDSLLGSMLTCLLPLPPEDPTLFLRVTGLFTICLYQYDSNKRFSSAYKFQGLAAQQRRPAQSADHKDVIMQLKGMACHPHKAGDQCRGSWGHQGEESGFSATSEGWGNRMIQQNRGTRYLDLERFQLQLRIPSWTSGLLQWVGCQEMWDLSPGHTQRPWDF